MELNKPIKVLFIVSSLSRAGAETQVVDLVNSVNNKNFLKYFLTFEKNLDQYFRIDHKNVTFFNYPRKHKYDFSIFKKIANVIDTFGIDIVHCSVQISLFFGWFALKFAKSKPKLITAIHTTTPKNIKEVLYNTILYQWLLRDCNKIIFVCKMQYEYWKRNYPFLADKSVVIHNGVDTSYFNYDKVREKGCELRRTLSIPEDSKVICCIAGFRSEKGHDTLVKAFASLDKYNYLILAGDGPRKKEIKALVEKSGVDKRVKFLGVVQDVRPIFACSDISVLASTAVETFSMAMLESMSMKVPVIATDIGGLSESIIPGQTGDLVPIGNSNILALSIKNMLADESQMILIKNQCRKLVSRNFSVEKMALLTEQLFISTY